MTWLSRTIAALLIIIVCAVVITEVFSHTILNSHYVEQKAANVNAYGRLSSSLSIDLAKDASQNAITTPQAEAIISNILTPQVLQYKINATLNTLSAYYKGANTVPTLDLTSLVAQARVAGVPISSNNELSKPITLSANPQFKNLGKNLENTKLAMIILGIVLISSLVAICWRRHHYTVLAYVAIISGVLLGIFATILMLSPSVANNFIKFNFSSNAFASVAHDLATNILHDVGKTIGIIALIMLVAGLVTRILLAKFQPKLKTAPAFTKSALKVP